MKSTKAYRHLDAVRRSFPLDKHAPLHRTSRSGTPHLVGVHNSVTYSVVYFGQSKQYKLFWPWLSQEQQSSKHATPAEVVTAILTLGENQQ